MEFKLSSLKKYLDTNASTDEILQKLDEIGLEVESFEDNAKKYQNFVIAKVISAEQHPNADSLRVCQVNDGSTILNIVCGASNARGGIKVVLARVGAIVPNGGFQIKKSKIRGVESEGMLCSAEELDLSKEESDGIIELPSDAQVGAIFSEYAGLDDVLIDISLTPNRRKDCASVYGIARELAAAGLGTLNALEAIPQNNDGDAPTVSVSIEAQEYCSQFNYFTCSKIDLQKLPSLKQQSKNGPIVDLSNFIITDIGNPNHIYDLDKIRGNVAVRLSKAEEQFIALGGKEYTLPGGLLVICDDEKILCLAGVMGGELSKVDENTKNVLVEVANFSPQMVSLAGQKLGIISDSRFRFEGGIDHASVDVASAIIRSHLEQFDCSRIERVYGDQNKFVEKITISTQQIEKYLGITVCKDEVLEILERAWFEPKLIAADTIDLSIPTWKQGNVQTYYDVIEEILRMGLMYKLNAAQGNRRFVRGSDVTGAMMASVSENSHRNMGNPRIISSSTTSQIRDLLIGRGMSEAYSFSFYSSDEVFKIEQNHISKYCLNKHSTQDEMVKLNNPINSNFTHMRRSILPNLIEAISKHPNNKESSLSIFEIGNIYSNLFENMEAISICGARTGDLFSNPINNKQRQFSFFDVREDAMSILGKLNMSNKITDYTLDSDVPAYYHSSKSVRIKLGNIVLGMCGELNPELIKTFDIPHKTVAIFEIFTQNIPSKAYKLTQYKEAILPVHQQVKRDLAFIVDNSVKIGDIIKTINGVKEKMISDVDVFDVYHGVEGGKKSVAMTITIQPEANITDEAVNGIIDRVIKAIKEKNNGILRDK